MDRKFRTLPLYIFQLLNELEDLEIDKDEIKLVKKAITQFRDKFYEHILEEQVYKNSRHPQIMSTMVIESVKRRISPVLNSNELAILKSSDSYGEYMDILLKNPNINVLSVMDAHKIDVGESIDQLLKHKSYSIKMTDLKQLYNKLTRPYDAGFVSAQSENASEKMIEEYNARASKIKKELDNNVYPEFTKKIREKITHNLTEEERAFAQEYLSKIDKNILGMKDVTGKNEVAVKTQGAMNCEEFFKGLK